MPTLSQVITSSKRQGQFRTTSELPGATAPVTWPAPKPSPKDAFRRLFSFWRENALRPTRGDVRHAVELALRTWPEKTQREIAAQVGCSLGSVATIKGQLFSREQLPDAPATVTGKDGKVYPTSKPNRLKARRVHYCTRHNDVPTGVGQLYASVQLPDARCAGPGRGAGRKTPRRTVAIERRTCHFSPSNRVGEGV